MNASLWQLAAWTMIHSLWLGAAVALAGGFLRLACRRAAPNTRYAISLATLAALTLTPLAAAAWLSVNGVPQLAVANLESASLPLPLGDGTKRARSPVATERSAVARAQQWGEGQRQVPAPNPHSQILPSESKEPGTEFPAIIDLAHATPTELDALAAQAQGAASSTTTPPPAPPIPHSSFPISPPTYSPTHLLTTTLPYLPTLWLIGAPVTFALLATGLVGSERLRRRATPLTAGIAFDACQRLRQTLNITRRVALAASDGVAQPILVGIVRPLILLPTAALAGWTPEELDMVLLHELAHVRRWDNLVNLAQRIVESLLFFHPAAWLVSRQVRRDREECCDAAVIRHTNRPEAYATLLIDIASRLRLNGQLSPAQSLTVASAMASHPLAGRIRRILNLEAEPMRITRRTLAATLLLPLLLAAAILYSGASAQDPPPSTGGAGGGIPDASGANLPDSAEKTGDESTKSGNPPADAPFIRRVYPIASGNLIDPIELAKAMHRHRIEITWLENQQRIVVSAPDEVHQRIAPLLLKQGSETVASNHGPIAPAMAAVPESAADSNPPIDVETSHLQNEIRILQDLIGKTQKELVDIQVFKELSVRQANNPATLEAAVNAELEKDPTNNMYKQQLFELQSQLQSKLAVSNDPQSAEIQRLRSVIEKTEAQATQYRSEAERALREKIAKMPNDTLRAAITEYKIRRKSAEENLTKYEQDLAAAQAKLAQLASTAPAQLAPLLDRLEQLRAAFDAQRPLFEKDPNSPLQKVRYDGADLPNIVDDHWHYLVKGIGNEPGKPPIWFNWSRLGGKQYEIEVPAAAHEKFFRPMFDGQLPTVGVGSPVSPNQDAAPSGSISDNAQPTANASPNSAAPVQEPEPPADQTPAMNTNAQADSNEIDVHFPQGFPDSDQERERIRKSLEAEGFKVQYAASQYGDRLTRSLRVNIPNGLPAKPVWESRPEGMVVRIINEPAGSPGSQNQGGEATGSKPDMARTSNQASPNSPAPVQEPEPPTKLAPVHAPPPTHPSVLRGLASLEQLSQGPTTAEIQRAFLVRHDNPEVTHKYDVFPSMRKGIADRLEKLATHPLSQHVNVKWKWIDDNTRIQVIAPEEAHRLLFDRPLSDELIDLPHKPSSPFPTLENQKIADRAYKLLGLELEPADGEDLRRIKKLGYNGGLRVTRANEMAGTVWGDLLVGLHAWPVTDFKSLNEVLLRDDLGELNPLKYYVIRKEGSGRFGSSPDGEDVVVTGRLQIPDAELLSRGLELTNQAVAQLTASAPTAGDYSPDAGQTAPNAPAAATPTASTTTSPPNQTFLYDGKTFDQWRDLWKLELNPERRTEAINALAAFSRAGYGDEAIEAILDVAAEYDFTLIDGDAEDKLKERILKQLSDRAGVATPKDPWIPLLLRRLEQDPEKWRGLAVMLFSRATPPHREAFGGLVIMSAENIEHLRKFAADPQHAQSPYVLAALYRVAGRDPAVDSLLKEAFSSPNSAASLGALQGVAFTRLDEFPEQFEMLFAEDEKTRKEARLVLVQNYSEDRHHEVLTRLLGVLDDPGQSTRHVDAIRALGAIGRVRDPMRPGLETETRKLISGRLEKIRKEGPVELFVPSSVALSSMYSAYSRNESKDLMKDLPAERKKLMDESAEQLKQEEASLF
ncbi:M56 family metallopeptidase [Lacipirellula limnantheis]|uniref:Regulatory protein BlaR1 n=1 Tax=Lacipirellula limnantheis TaxID=2528024 RepID=A0A517U6A0_9BACT|nr:M56 family metallopeptidase [Lacipirellula limnantheis]QDT76161.1 Regulatory protein BlaR1 [Lacipirellula limnantheis]